MKLHWSAYSKTPEYFPIYGKCPNCTVQKDQHPSVGWVLESTSELVDWVKQTSEKGKRYVASDKLYTYVPCPECEGAGVVITGYR